nr:AMP-binding protein [Xenorhabdus lircayensis]
MKYGNQQQLGDTKSEQHNSQSADLIREYYLQATGQSPTAAIPGVQAYVLNERLQLVPMGVSGELYLSGPELNNGHWGQPALTTKGLLANPFAQHANDQWLYRTGEQVRWLPNGELEYLNAKLFKSMREAS